MTIDDPPYDDNAALTTYLFRYYVRLMTTEEALANREVWRTMKLASVSSTMAQRLRQRWGKDHIPAVDELLADGIDTFRHRVRERIMRDSADEVEVNRCPECSRIVRTPLAKQCLWCGFDWH